MKKIGLFLCLCFVGQINAKNSFTHNSMNFNNSVLSYAKVSLVGIGIATPSVALHIQPPSGAGSLISFRTDNSNPTYGMRFDASNFNLGANSSVLYYRVNNGSGIKTGLALNQSKVALGALASDSTDFQEDLTFKGNTWVQGTMKKTDLSGGIEFKGSGNNTYFKFSYSSSPANFFIYFKRPTDSSYNFIKLSLSKSFVIQHPLKQDQYLVHATLEGPSADAIYWGKGKLKNGVAKVELPPYFEALTRVDGRHVIVTSADGFDNLAVQEKNNAVINKGQFYVYSDNKQSTQTFYWMVKATRKDIKPLEVEPLKKNTSLAGEGPYRYVR